MGCEERKSSESEERVSAHGRPIRENYGYGVERLEMSFDGKSYSHNIRRQFMMTKDKYNVNYDADTYQSLSHKAMFTQMNPKKAIKLFGEKSITAMFKEYKQLDDGTIPGKPVVETFNTYQLTTLDRKKILEAMNLIK